MGKTTLFKVAANLNYMTVRNFLIEPHTADGKALFLDALDEYRTLVTGQLVLQSLAKRSNHLFREKIGFGCVLLWSILPALKMEAKRAFAC
jgi:hypothetical protein